jgi:hypothetical protein
MLKLLQPSKGIIVEVRFAWGLDQLELGSNLYKITQLQAMR